MAEKLKEILNTISNINLMFEGKYESDFHKNNSISLDEILDQSYKGMLIDKQNIKSDAKKVATDINNAFQKIKKLNLVNG